MSVFTNRLTHGGGPSTNNMSSLMKDSWNVAPTPKVSGPSLVETVDNGVRAYVNSVPAQALTAMLGTGALFLTLRPPMAGSIAKAGMWMLGAGVLVATLSYFVTWGGVKSTVTAASAAAGVAGGVAALGSATSQIIEV